MIAASGLEWVETVEGERGYYFIWTNSAAATSAPRGTPRRPRWGEPEGLGSVDERSYERLKRCIDVSFAAAGLVVLSPVIAGVGIVVRRSLGSPVIFRQDRPGLHGHRHAPQVPDDAGPRPGGDESSDGERLTPTGAFLRSTSLDELPELVNVLWGEMSLVGPRPLLMQYLARYSPGKRGGTR